MASRRQERVAEDVEAAAARGKAFPRQMRYEEIRESSMLPGGGVLIV
jgi:hypothetical protein